MDLLNLPKRSQRYLERVHRKARKASANRPGVEYFVCLDHFPDEPECLASRFFACRECDWSEHEAWQILAVYENGHRTDR